MLLEKREENSTLILLFNSGKLLTDKEKVDDEMN